MTDTITNNVTIAKHHYFVSNFFGWSTAETADSAIKQLAMRIGEKALAAASDHDCGIVHVFKVALPLNSYYRIERWQPYGVAPALLEVEYTEAGTACNLHESGEYVADRTLQLTLAGDQS